MAVALGVTTCFVRPAGGASDQKTGEEEAAYTKYKQQSTKMTAARQQKLKWSCSNEGPQVVLRLDSRVP